MTCAMYPTSGCLYTLPLAPDASCSSFWGELAASHLLAKKRWLPPIPSHFVVAGLAQATPGIVFGQALPLPGGSCLAALFQLGWRTDIAVPACGGVGSHLCHPHLPAPRFNKWPLLPFPCWLESAPAMSLKGAQAGGALPDTHTPQPPRARLKNGSLSCRSWGEGRMCPAPLSGVNTPDCATLHRSQRMA